MIKSIEVYLVTDGNGQEAIEFYKNAFNAEVLSVTTFGEQIPDCPEENKNLILNAQLKIGNQRLMLSDENPEYVYENKEQLRHNVTACIIVDNKEEATEIYSKLSVDAKNILLPLQETFWSPAYANLEDKFGVLWQISTEI